MGRALELQEHSDKSEAWPGPIFSENMQSISELQIMKYGTKTLSGSNMVVIFSCLVLIWCHPGVIKLKCKEAVHNFGR